MGYPHNLLKYCAMGINKRFGIVKFVIGCDVTPGFKKAVSEIPEGEWKPYFREVKGEKIKTVREWAEVCFVPSAIGHSKNGPEYRYIAKLSKKVNRRTYFVGGNSIQISKFPYLLKLLHYAILTTFSATLGKIVINWGS